jgi:S1-C subfamily serine protease
MKKATIFLALGLIFLPSIVSAAWWNPSTWKKAQKVETTVEQASSTTEVYAPPSTEELLRRIAELEDKLQKALSSKKEVASVKVETKAVETPVVESSGLSQNEISAKVRPAIVLVETATSSASGIIIDGQGRILTSAHAVWLEDGGKHVIGTHESVIVTLSSGAKKEAILIGLDEATDLAVLQLVSKSASTYLKLNYDAGVAVGDKIFIVGAPSARANGGSSIVAGSVVKKSSAVIEVNTDEKPLDMGGALVSSSGAFIGIQNPSACKVLEEGNTCLKYKVTADNKVKARLPKLLEGMRLFRDKKETTPDEKLIGGKLEGVHQATASYGTVDTAYDYVTGKNSFSYLDKRLNPEENDRGQITRIYLNKLSIASNNIFKAYESLKSQAYDLHVFFINEEVAIAGLGSYQKKVLAEINAFNEVKLKEYTAKVTEWSKKKNEYDARLADYSDTTQDYLMVEGAALEKAVGVLRAEKKKITTMFSGENVEIF